jgi:hypothetical protein
MVTVNQEGCETKPPYKLNALSKHPPGETKALLSTSYRWDGSRSRSDREFSKVIQTCYRWLISLGHVSFSCTEVFSGHRKQHGWVRIQCFGDFLCLHHQGSGRIVREDFNAFIRRGNFTGLSYIGFSEKKKLWMCKLNIVNVSILF